MVPVGTDATVLHLLVNCWEYADCVVWSTPAASVPVAHIYVGDCVRTESVVILCVVESCMEVMTVIIVTSLCANESANNIDNVKSQHLSMLQNEWIET